MYFKDLFEISDYRKIVLMVFLSKNDVDFLNKCGYLKNDFNCLCERFKKV